MKKILGLAVVLVIFSGCSSDYWLRSTGLAALADKLKREDQKEEDQRQAVESEK